MTDEQARLKRRHKQEKRSRKEAEALLESKSQELYYANEALKKFVEELEEKIKEISNKILCKLLRIQANYCLK